MHFDDKLLMRMLWRALLFAWIATGSFAFGAEDAVAVAEAQVQSASERVAAQAQRILQTFKSSEYSHKTKVDENAGKYDVDCSGLVCIILKKIAPAAYKSVPKIHGKSRPLAADFFECFDKAPSAEAGEKGWRRISNIAGAKPGDFIAWRRIEIVPGEDTGHIVIVDEAPVREDDGQIRVTIIDSTKGPHAGDTRKNGATGVGRGTMWFTVDADGKPAGYRWRSKTGTLTKRPIAVGRLVDFHD